MRYISALLLALFLPLLVLGQNVTNIVKGQRFSVGTNISNVVSGGGGGGFPSGSIFDVKLNGNPNDSGPNTYTGTAVGSPSYTTGQDGLANHAIALNGSSQYVTFSSVGTTFDFGSSTSFTISAWIQFNANQAGNPAVFQKRHHQFDNGFTLLFIGLSTVESIVSDGSHTVASDVSASLNDNNWHLIVMTVDRSGQLLHFYVDGSEVGSAKDITSVGSVTSTEQVYIGNGLTSADHIFTGNIDECAVWNTALTSTQVGNIFTTGAR